MADAPTLRERWAEWRARVAEQRWAKGQAGADRIRARAAARTDESWVDAARKGWLGSSVLSAETRQANPLPRRIHLVGDAIELLAGAPAVRSVPVAGAVMRVILPTPTAQKVAVTITNAQRTIVAEFGVEHADALHDFAQRFNAEAAALVPGPQPGD